ncbi:MAG TPA: nuclear transport factor 2 family protein [Solirubrobacteraceae bacterium]|nr:nuclear transport factor 2 family protein [Solirubrobacteraceae bacterium]
MSHENVELVRAGYEEANRLGEPAWWFLAPDIEWHTRADLPDSEVYRGHDAVRALFQEWTNAFEDARFDIQDVLDRGDYVVVPTVLRGRIRGSADEVAMPETHVLKIRDGMAVELREYATLDEALEAVGLAE